LADSTASGKIGGMDARKLSKLRKDLAAFLDVVVGTWGNARRRRWCEAYVRGVLLDGANARVSSRWRSIEED